MPEFGFTAIPVALLMGDGHAAFLMSGIFVGDLASVSHDTEVTQVL
jgi:ABC-type uncharacterized transport system permease subunit